MSIWNIGTMNRGPVPSAVNNAGCTIIKANGSGGIWTCQYQTILHASPPRSECPEHGVRVVKMPWAEPNSRFTALFERLAIDWLKVASQKAVAENLDLSWDEL